MPLELVQQSRFIDIGVIAFDIGATDPGVRGMRALRQGFQALNGLWAPAMAFDMLTRGMYG